MKVFEIALACFLAGVGGIIDARIYGDRAYHQVSIPCFILCLFATILLAKAFSL